MQATRRAVLAGSAVLAMPAIAVGQARRVLKFIPESDVTVIDPIWTTATVTRNHGYLVFDTLYGQAADYSIHPQMVAGHTIEQDGKLWRLTLRDGLRFHDDTPVLAKDCVASIRRFAARDAFARALMDATDELSAASDTAIQFRLKTPFPLLPAALGKTGTSMPCIMPERLAITDPNKQVTEMTGSGPFRFNTSERVPGSRVVYEKFAGYVPRPDGPATFTAGPKQVHYDRIEWHVISDASTSANALVNGEVSWWQNTTPDLQGLLRSKGATVFPLDPTGNMTILRFNHLHPPFDNQAIRQALLGAVDQIECMTGVVGDDASLRVDHVGVFSPGTPLASREGTEGLVGPRDFPRVKRALAEAGYRGERIVVLHAQDQANTHAAALVATDALQKAGMNLDVVTADWGTVVQRRASKQPPDKGGWHIFFTNLTGTNNLNPASQLGIRGNGEQAWFGWPTAPKLEALRQDWFAAPDLDAQKRVALEIQRQFFIDVPYLPLGAYFDKSAQRGLQGIRNGFPQFYDVRPA